MACVRKWLHGWLRCTAAAVLVLSGAGCGIRKDEVLARKHPSNEGDNTQVGKIKIRNVSIVGPAPTAQEPAGASAPVYFTLINDGPTEDALVQVSAEGVAKTVDMSKPEIPMGARQLVWVGTGPYTVTLRDLVRPLTVGQYVTLRMRFRTAGEVTVRDVPVKNAAVASTLPSASSSG
ncbi:copper chaperone PCu(A)C [Microtetraspora sp. NBRC 16547]|uniref:copper chaperone PCu(A)C n=1 Tax=Microtetraspora sp. NBRC 16547 TaxID=3030993 RepID=UPI0025540C9F|nr:copper chaperone PCu(A)C [Microtetraspora sp. NBRC 16547]